MSDAGNLPPLPEPSARHYTAGQIAMMVIGAILLLPGICSVAFIVAMIPDIRRGDPYLGAVAALWIICFFISAAGVALIFAARSRAARVG